jgi:ribosomal protein S18 acetylase RimI-like enzyme
VDVITGSVPIFATTDIRATLEYYKETLGFQTTWTWGDPPSFGGANWGPVSIMFSLQPDLAAKISGHEHWIKVEEIDELYALHQKLGAKIVTPIDNQPWGAREYVVADPSDYRLRFAGSPTSPTGGSIAFPDGVQIIRRIPTYEEFVQVAGQEFDFNGNQSESLAATWEGVVAVSPAGDTIGTVRIMHDAPGWFSIWDVAVLPDWQGKRIGETMMREALQAVREAAPGAFVFLFTTKHGFYERFGFSKETVSMVKV